MPMASTGKAFQNVAVAFDGSDDSVKAIRLACSIASEFGSKLIVVHVYSSLTTVFAGGAGVPVLNYGELEDAAKAAATATLSKGVQTAAQYGVKARGELIEAPSVVEALVGFATDQKIDLVVVGTRGMTGFKKLIMGSVASGLVSHARCPVMVVR